MCTQSLASLTILGLRLRLLSSHFGWIPMKAHSVVEHTYRTEGQFLLGRRSRQLAASQGGDMI